MQDINELDFTDEQHEICINPDDIAGYIIRRSPASRLLFNVFCVSFKDEILFCEAADLDLETAMAHVEVVNQKYFPVILSPTDIAFESITSSKPHNITIK